MTTLTSWSVPVHLEEDASLEPLPWRRMAWVTWRQHRVALVGLAVLLGAIAVYLWFQGRQMHHAYGVALACHPASSGACVNAINYFTSTYDTARKVTPLLLQALPALIGAFLGAPVLAREFETGTFRYAWTQGFGRWRWTLAKLVSLAVLAAAAAELLSLLFSWYYQPFIADGQTNSLAASTFDLRGIAFAFWTLVAFAIGGMAGMLIRRVVPALVATLVTYAGLVLVVGMFLRQHYLTPLIARQQSLSVSSALVTGNWATKGGRTVFSFAGEPSGNILGQFCPSGVTVKPSSGLVGGFAQCLSQHGYTLWASYQPASRFWPFQWIEGGWLLALSVVVIATTVWLVQRRVA